MEHAVNHNYPKVLFLSALKPVTDTRMFEKMALSLRQLPLQIHIGGQAGYSPLQGKVNFHSFSGRGRLSVLLQAQKLILDLKPRLVLACSPDLLLVAARLKSKGNFKLVYDIQENYSLNYKHLYGSNWLKTKLANLIFEQSLKAAGKSADAIVLAEDIYTLQMPELSHSVVLENKMSEEGLAYAQPHISWPTDKLELVFTGTLSAQHGLFDAILFAEKLCDFGPVRLKIIGYSGKQNGKNELLQLIKNKPFVETYGIDQQVPHQTVLQHIAMAHAGLVFYNKNDAFAGKAPTKMFEYLCLGKRALVLNYLQFRLPTSRLIMPLDSSKYASKDLYNRLLQPTEMQPGENLMFESGKFRDLVKNLISMSFSLAFVFLTSP